MEFGFIISDGGRQKRIREPGNNFSLYFSLSEVSDGVLS